MTTAHTETPYQVGKKIKRAVYAGDEIICMCDSMDELSYAQEAANAEFIARACNAHNDLVKALQGLLFAVRSNHPGGSPKTADEIFAEAGHAAIDALLKAGAE